MTRCPLFGSAGLVAVALVIPALGHADQLQCLSQTDADRAVALLQPGTVAISFCSLCEDYAAIVRVSRATTIQDCNTEVQLTGTVAARSTKILREKYPPNVRYRPSQDPFNENVDLAYVYVETAANRFDWLGGVLGLRATVNVPRIVLPQDTYRALGQHVRPQVQPRPVLEAPVAKVSTVKLNWFAAAGIRQMAIAWDAGHIEEARATANKSLDALITQSLAKVGLEGLPAQGALRQLLVNALQERLSMPHLPLRSIHTGRELKVLEELPTRQLERVMAVLALWAAITAHSNGQADALGTFARAVLSDPTTLADLHRRKPRGAALARFYAVIYLARFAPEPGLDPDERLLVERLAQYFNDEKAAFKGNYGRVLPAMSKP